MNFSLVHIEREGLTILLIAETSPPRLPISTDNDDKTRRF